MEAAEKKSGSPTDRVVEALSTLLALLDRTISEIKTIDGDFQGRLVKSISETETTVRNQAAHELEAALSETRTKLEEQFKSRMSELSTQWEDERNRLNAELGKMTQSAVQWEAERARLNAEVEKLVRVQAATQAEAENAIMAMKMASAAAKSSKANPVENDALTSEISRVEQLIKSITALIDDPATDLSTVIRKNVERAELESYLNGIRYALNGGNSK